MRRTMAWMIVLLALAGCSRGDPQQMIETARFEELQRNTTHAREIYQRLVSDYPDSPQAAEARQRLQALDAEDAETP